MHVDIYVKDILNPQLLFASFASKNSMRHPVCVAAAAQLPVYLLGEPVSLLASISLTHHHQSIPLEASRQLHGTPGPVQVLSSRVSRHAECSAYMYWPAAYRVPWPKLGLINHHVLMSSPDAPSHTTRCRPLKADSKYISTMCWSSLLSLSLRSHQVANPSPYSRRHPVPHHWRVSSQLLTRNTRRFCARILRTKHVDRYTDRKIQTRHRVSVEGQILSNPLCADLHEHLLETLTRTLRLRLACLPCTEFRRALR
jgi:hypothetical protein